MSEVPLYRRALLIQTRRLIAAPSSARGAALRGAVWSAAGVTVYQRRRGAVTALHRRVAVTRARRGEACPASAISAVLQNMTRGGGVQRVLMLGAAGTRAAVAARRLGSTRESASRESERERARESEGEGRSPLAGEEAISGRWRAARRHRRARRTAAGATWGAGRGAA